MTMFDLGSPGSVTPSSWYFAGSDVVPCYLGGYVSHGFIFRVATPDSEGYARLS